MYFVKLAVDARNQFTLWKNMKEFDELLEIIERLLGPGGCPWDQEQTLKSLRSSLLEETCEVLEAIDLEDNAHIKEELGDLLFNAAFLSRIGEKEKRFLVKEVIQEINQKLIRRHPHVFGEGTKINNVEELHKQWDTLKKHEKGKDVRTSALDGIPKNFPGLARAQKCLKKMRKVGYNPFLQSLSRKDIENEKDLGKYLLYLVELAEEKGLDAEHALRAELAHVEKEFLDYEKKHS